MRKAVLLCLLFAACIQTGRQFELISTEENQYWLEDELVDFKTETYWSGIEDEPYCMVDRTIPEIDCEELALSLPEGVTSETANADGKEIKKLSYDGEFGSILWCEDTTLYMISCAGETPDGDLLMDLFSFYVNK